MVTISILHRFYIHKKKIYHNSSLLPKALAACLKIGKGLWACLFCHWLRRDPNLLTSILRKGKCINGSIFRDKRSNDTLPTSFSFFFFLRGPLGHVGIATCPFVYDFGMDILVCSKDAGTYLVGLVQFQS